MKVEFSAFPKAFSGNVAVLVGADKQLLATAQTLDKASNGGLTRAIGQGRFTGAKNQTSTILGNTGGVARLLLLGAGKGRDLDSRTAEGLGGVVAAEANAAGHKAVTVVVDPVKGSKLTPAQIAARIALGARLRNYRFDKYKTKDKPEQKLSLEQLTVVVGGPAEARQQRRDQAEAGVPHQRSEAAHRTDLHRRQLVAILQPEILDRLARQGGDDRGHEDGLGDHHRLRRE